MQKYERRRSPDGKARRIAFRDLKRRQRSAGMAAERTQRRPWTIHHGDRRKPGDVPPAPPQMKLAQIVGAHDPHKTNARRPFDQPGDRIMGEARADLRLKACHSDARIARHRARGFDAKRQGRQSVNGLERIARRHQPPQSVELESPQRQPRDKQMAVMRWVERPAHQADSLARGPTRQPDGHQFFPKGSMAFLTERPAPPGVGPAARRSMRR
jgi:hypothetical protein